MLSYMILFSTKDSTIFTFKGKSKKKISWCLLQDEEENNKNDQLVYGNEEGGIDHLNRLRVYLTFTMNSIGMLTAIFIAVTSITERERAAKERTSIE